MLVRILKMSKSAHKRHGDLLLRKKSTMENYFPQDVILPCKECYHTKSLPCLQIFLYQD